MTALAHLHAIGRSALRRRPAIGRVALCLLAVAACALSCQAQRTTRKVKPEKAAVTQPLSQWADTIAGYDAVALSGYEKPLRARRETFFATNSGPTHIYGIEISINYIDYASRRQLHNRKMWVSSNIPPGETRQISIPTWDTNFSFYYFPGDKPRKSAHPYLVTIDVLRIITDK